MKRLTLNVLIDITAAVTFLGLVLTGYVIRFPLPPRTGKSHLLWGLDRHEWGTIHFWISSAFLLILLIHVALHWSWVTGLIRKRLSVWKKKPLCQKQTAMSGVAFLTFVLLSFVIFAWAAHSSVRRVDGSRGQPLDVYASAGQHADEEATRSGPAKSKSEEKETGMVFHTKVYPIFNNYCVRCHGPERQDSDFRADRLSDFIEASPPWIVPGQGDASPIIEFLSGSRGRKHTLAGDQVAIIREWIDEGAKWPDSEQ